MSETNFDRAVTRMRARGSLPFTPDGTSNARTLRWLPGQQDTFKLGNHAERMDAIIAAFCLGVALGMLIGAPASESPPGQTVAAAAEQP